MAMLGSLGSWMASTVGFEHHQQTTNLMVAIWRWPFGWWIDGRFPVLASCEIVCLFFSILDPWIACPVRYFGGILLSKIWRSRTSFRRFHLNTLQHLKSSHVNVVDHGRPHGKKMKKNMKKTSSGWTVARPYFSSALRTFVVVADPMTAVRLGAIEVPFSWCHPNHGQLGFAQVTMGGSLLGVPKTTTW